MSAIYAYFMTWPTYGTWLPGDSRGWNEYNHGRQNPNVALNSYSRRQMSEPPCLLNPLQRAAVEQAIEERSRHRNWSLFALSCRSTHIHLLLYAPEHPSEIRRQCKAWSTRKLRELDTSRKNWWAERGSCYQITSEDGLIVVASYINDVQDAKCVVLE